MPDDVRRVCGESNVGFWLDNARLLGWPDTSFIPNIVFGFPITGHIDSPPVFRPCCPSTDLVSPESLLAGSLAYVDRLESSARPASDPDQDQALLDQTLKDVNKFCSPPVGREFLDSKYGAGMISGEQLTMPMAIY